MIIISISIVTYYWFNSTFKLTLKPHAVFSGVDKFGINEIYPTSPSGREWFINMQNPLIDPLFSITNNIPIKKDNNDSAWIINGSNIRMNVITSKLLAQWKNIEMTGYIKINSLPNQTISSNSKGNSNSNNNNEEGNNIADVDWRARGGTHNNNVPCEGTSLNGGINIDGKVSWKKEIWHTGGYTDTRGVDRITNSISGKWIGWKIAIYNIENNKAVKMESYLDDKDNNQWVKVDDIIDNGGWYANSPDSLFYSANCDKPKDYIITNSGPIATFRADNVELQFKNLSIREIQT